MKIKSCHLIKIIYLRSTPTKDYRIKLSSLNGMGSITLTYDRDFKDRRDQAVDWLQKKGHNIIGVSTDYIITDTFHGF